MKNYMIFLLLFLSSCTHFSQNDALQFALQRAGENRAELEKILKHYSGSPENDLKYKAAVYLIENRPYHYSYVMTPAIEHHLDQIEIQMDSLKKEPFEIKVSVYREILKKDIVAWGINKKGKAHFRDWGVQDNTLFNSKLT